MVIVYLPRVGHALCCSPLKDTEKVHLLLGSVDQQPLPSLSLASSFCLSYNHPHSPSHSFPVDWVSGSGRIMPNVQLNYGRQSERHCRKSEWSEKEEGSQKKRGRCGKYVSGVKDTGKGREGSLEKNKRHRIKRGKWELLMFFFNVESRATAVT